MTHLRSVYYHYQSLIDPVKLPIYYYGRDMMLESVLDGAEIQLEMYLQRGRVIFHSFSSEYAPDRSYIVFPLNISAAAQAALLELAQRTATEAIGLTDGVVHCELFYSPTQGANLIEVNNRLSRGFLPRHFLSQLMHGAAHTDYHAAAVHLALGVPPPTFARRRAPVSLAVFPDAKSRTGWETHAPCAIFVAATPQEALQQGLQFRQRTAKTVDYVDREL